MGWVGNGEKKETGSATSSNQIKSDQIETDQIGRSTGFQGLDSCVAIGLEMGWLSSHTHEYV